MCRSTFKAIFLAIVCFGASLSADTGLHNLSCRHQKSCSKINLFGNALYWSALETADWAATITQSSQVEEIAYKTIAFDRSLGFRVGIGYHLETDSWDTKAFYTCFSASSKDHANGTIHSAFFGQTVSAVGYFQTAAIQSKIHYNMFDWDVGRFFFICKNLSFRPSIGLKGGGINQSLKTSWEKPELFFTLLADENVTNNFVGVGSKFSIKGKWNLINVKDHFFSLVSEAESAFLSGRWKIHDLYKDNFFVTVKTIVKDRSFGATCLKAYLGGEWDVHFEQDRLLFALRVGYEIEDWLDQFQVFDDASGGNSNDLVLQGLSFDLSFVF